MIFPRHKQRSCPGQSISRILSGTSPVRSSIWESSYLLPQAAYPGLFPRRATSLSLLGLAPDGGCLAEPITGPAGGLLHHLFTITGRWDHLLRLYVSVARSGKLLRPGSYPASCSVECGLSSKGTPFAIARPTWVLDHNSQL